MFRIWALKYLTHVYFTGNAIIICSSRPKVLLKTIQKTVEILSMVFTLMLKAIHWHHKLLAKRDVENHEKPD